MRFCTTMLFSILVSATSTWSADSRLAISSNLFSDLAGNVTALGQQPRFWGGLFMFGAVPSVFDDETNHPYRSWTNRIAVDHVFEAGNVLGNGIVHIGAAISLYSIGKIGHSEEMAGLGSDLFSALVISGALSTGLKVATNRRRPDGAPYSFPSGHSTMAFTTAGVIANRYGTIPGIAAEAVAGYVGLSRLQENKHYISDVVAGCLLGNIVAHEVVGRNRLTRNLGISPVTSGGNAGAALLIHLH